jgi:hypothetical protein
MSRIRSLFGAWRRRRLPSLIFAAVALTVALTAAPGCPKDKAPAQLDGAGGAATPGAPGAGATPGKLDQLPRAELNRRAAELALPIFWRSDANGDGALDPDELAVLWGIADTSISEWVKDGAFTKKMVEAYAAMTAQRDLTTLAPEEQARRQAVLEELAQGRPTLIETDLTKGSAEDRAIVENVLAAARLIEQIYARQNGVDALRAQLAADDPASRMLFHRNQGPACEAPKTETNPDCNALAARPKKISGLYPANLQNGVDTKFCEVLEKRKDADRIMHQFVVVRAKQGGRSEGDPATDDLEAVPYHEAFKAEMEQVSAKLKAAAAAIEDPAESAFKAYLLAAAQAFTDNKWEPADEAWAKMTAENSKWYLRIGPDETYFEPCSRKAGFHVSFARINLDSLEWQRKLEPVKTELEGAVAALAGPPYKAREVSFHLPDFIDMVINAGDSRSALGATIGQSLPNWGPVANEGRGRTVAMTNLYLDKDSEQAWNEQVSSLFCSATMEKVSFDPKLAVMSTVLHEAAHNLGPAHEYKVGGKTDDQAFGGALASMLEELKAQTLALFYADWLVGKGIVDQKTADGAHLRDVTWAFGHIAQGMYTAEGKPKAYSQLAAIQLGQLHKDGVLTWNAEAAAANGKDRGCFEVDLGKWKASVDALAKTVAGIKGRGDKPLAEKLKKEFVDDAGAWAELRGTIQERWLRAPKASFVYAIAGR